MSIEFQYLTKKLASSQQVIKVSLKANRVSTFILLLHCHIYSDLKSKARIHESVLSSN